MNPDDYSPPGASVPGLTITATSEEAALQTRDLDAKERKTALGQFFTREQLWLVRPVRQFIQERVASVRQVLDPFAGEGDLLRVVSAHFGLHTLGLDIAEGDWPQNDSLISIPRLPRTMILTNPPYLARNSARRRKLWHAVGKYLDDSTRDDLYQVALDRCLEAADVVVAIVPETLLLSNYQKHQLVLLAVIEEKLFTDTEVPVSVACFDRTWEGDTEIFVGERFACMASDITSARKAPTGLPPIRFNDPTGRLGLRAVDGVRADERISFALAGDFPYPVEAVRHSSRHLTYVEPSGVPDEALPAIVQTANRRIDSIREGTKDLAMAPFMGNNHLGRRRRRLDYFLARRVLEDAIRDVRPTGVILHEQLSGVDPV